MTEIITERMTAEVKEDLVVFLIGMRINKWWKVNQWGPIGLSMGRMINELYDNPDLGFVSHEQWFGRTTIMVQYWKSFEQLESYAKNTDAIHLPVWADFNKKVGKSGDVGIWHETYEIKKGHSESMYNNMPTFGLAKAIGSTPASGKLTSASGRLTEHK